MAASARASATGVLPPWAARTATSCWASASSRPSAANAASAVSQASCAACSASATARAESAAGAGTGWSGLPQTGQGSPSRSCGGELGCGVGEPLFAEVEPVLPKVLVFVPGRGVPFRNGRARGLGGEVAADDGHEFVRCRGLLGAQLDFGGEFLERADSGEQGRRFRAQGIQGCGAGPLPGFQLLQLPAQPAAAVRSARQAGIHRAGVRRARHAATAAVRGRSGGRRCRRGAAGPAAAPPALPLSPAVASAASVSSSPASSGSVTAADRSAVRPPARAVRARPSAVGGAFECPQLAAEHLGFAVQAQRDGFSARTGRGGVCVESGAVPRRPVWPGGLPARWRPPAGQACSPACCSASAAAGLALLRGGCRGVAQPGQAGHRVRRGPGRPRRRVRAPRFRTRPGPAAAPAC